MILAIIWIHQYVGGFKSLLRKPCSMELLKICARKFVTTFLHLIKEASEKRQKSFTPEICERFAKEIESIKTLCLKRCPTNDLSFDEIEAEFQILQQIHVLISSDLKSEEFNETMNALVEGGQREHDGIDSRAFGALLKACMDLRPDKGMLRFGDEEDEDEYDEELLCSAPLIQSLHKVYANLDERILNAKVRNRNQIISCLLKNIFTLVNLFFLYRLNIW